jgi:hypothetical protein
LSALTCQFFRTFFGQGCAVGSEVLDTLSYDSIDTLIKALKPAIIDPAIQKHNELRLIKAREPKIRSASDFIDDKGLDNQSD